MSRVSFEKWFKSNYGFEDEECEWLPSKNRYYNHTMQITWEAWKAAKRSQYVE